MSNFYKKNFKYKLIQHLDLELENDFTKLMSNIRKEHSHQSLKVQNVTLVKELLTFKGFHLMCYLPYNNFRTLKILVRFPRAKVYSNKIFKLSG